MQVSVRQIMEGLGGDRFVKQPVQNEPDLMVVVKEGLPIESLMYLQTNFGFTNKAMSYILSISESTYQRRIKAKDKLTQDETEKVIALSEVYERGIEVFENQPDFTEWLHSSIVSLQHQRPVDLLGSVLGRKQVMRVLNAILHGIYL